MTTSVLDVAEMFQKQLGSFAGDEMPAEPKTDKKHAKAVKKMKKAEKKMAKAAGKLEMKRLAVQDPEAYKLLKAEKKAAKKAKKAEKAGMKADAAVEHLRQLLG